MMQKRIYARSYTEERWTSFAVNEPMDERLWGRVTLKEYRRRPKKH